MSTMSTYLELHIALQRLDVLPQRLNILLQCVEVLSHGLHCGGYGLADRLEPLKDRTKILELTVRRHSQEIRELQLA